MYAHKMVCLYIILWYVYGKNGISKHIKWYVYIQNGMYGRVVRVPCTYAQFLWTTRKYSGQVVHSTIHMFRVYWTTRPHFKYLGTCGTEEVVTYLSK